MNQNQEVEKKTFTCKHCEHDLPDYYHHKKSPEYCFLCYLSEEDKQEIRDAVNRVFVT